MKSLRSLAVLLISTIAWLMVAEAAAAAGSGGKGDKAAVGIDTILLINPSVPGDDILAEISGGGFLGGDIVEVTLDGAVLTTAAVSVDRSTLLGADGRS
jgi:hypothetical protein